MLENFEECNEKRVCFVPNSKEKEECQMIINGMPMGCGCNTCPPKPPLQPIEPPCNTFLPQPDCNMCSPQPIQADCNVCTPQPIQQYPTHPVVSECGCKPGKCNCTPTPVACVPKSLCCEGNECTKFDPAKAQSVCTYINRIYTQSCGNGSSLFSALSDGLTSTVQYKPQAGCCTACTVDATSIFTVDCIQSFMLQFGLVDPTALTAEDVLINGKPALTLSYSATDGYYTATLDPTTTNLNKPECAAVCKGTKATLVINNLGPFTYIAKHLVSGSVTTNGATCNYDATFTDPAAGTAIGTTPQSIMIPNVCIPCWGEGGNIPTIRFKLDACATVLDPVVSYIGAPTAPLTLAGNILVTPILNAEIMQLTKVCMQGVIC